MDISTIKETSRRALHSFMGRPASYYAEPDPSSARIGTKARPHSVPEKAGDLAGTNLSYAETQDRRETVVFLYEDVDIPPRNSLVIFSADEGYFVNNTMPRDGITITCEVVRASSREMTGYTLPDGVTVI